MLINKFILVITILLLIFTHPPKANAQEVSNSFVTIVNPVRISSYTENPATSLRTEYNEIKKRNFAATWLLTYDVLLNYELMEILSSMDEKQELGIFLEITETSSSRAGISYNKTDSWHHANALFLSGYNQKDRKKFIDEVFSLFNEKFGYFPKSIGGWWVDSYSLSYMEEKYQITGVLGVSDQFDLDGYKVWGTPYSIPYYPSRVHTGIPGQGKNKLNVVALRWAARDPLNGYISPSDLEASIYSAQDYLQTGASDEYLEKLIDVYAVKKPYNKFGHIVIGQEADSSSDVFETIFARRLDLLMKFQEIGVNIISMDSFSDWYKAEFKNFTPHIVETDDLLGREKKAIWYQSSYYRLGMVYDYESEKLQIVDMRSYMQNFQEPFYISPNKQFTLSINLPFKVDYLNNKNSVIEKNVGKLEKIDKNKDYIEIKFEKESLILGEREIKSNIHITSIKENFEINPEGLVIKDFSFGLPFTVKTKLLKYYPVLTLFLFSIGLIIFVRRNDLKKYKKIIILSILITATTLVMIKVNTNYHISQSEVDALSVLKSLPNGLVLVYDKDCLRCDFETAHKPAAAGGVKKYVPQLSEKEVISDFSFVTAPTSEVARNIIKNKNVKYVYLAKYEEYIENLPYLPQDLNLIKVYENANAEIWKSK